MSYIYIHIIGINIGILIIIIYYYYVKKSIESETPFEPANDALLPLSIASSSPLVSYDFDFSLPAGSLKKG